MGKKETTFFPFALPSPPSQGAPEATLGDLSDRSAEQWEELLGSCAVLECICFFWGLVGSHVFFFGCFQSFLVFFVLVDMFCLMGF